MTWIQIVQIVNRRRYGIIVNYQCCPIEKSDILLGLYSRIKASGTTQSKKESQLQYPKELDETYHNWWITVKWNVILFELFWVILTFWEILHFHSIWTWCTWTQEQSLQWPACMSVSQQSCGQVVKWHAIAPLHWCFADGGTFQSVITPVNDR